ncbi:hypothetical protein ACFC58_06315 [Kitasatospora purpeofusca]|uniref:hypothetical protein n=1 Tax=Kitasatospora purpeofusca TaxID=67352 RepID=UPI0035DBB46A
MPTEAAESTLTLTRELAEQLQRQGLPATIGTNALSLGHAVLAVDVNGHPHVLSALYDNAQELSWSITDPGTYADHSSGILHNATIEQAAAHLAHVLAPYARAAEEEPQPSVPQMMLAALAAAGHNFEHWSSVNDPFEWLSAPTADGGELTIEDGTTRLPHSTDTYAGVRMRYAPVAEEDFGDQESTVFESPGLGHATGDGAARFAADLYGLVLAATACRRLIEERTRWESQPAFARASGRYHRAADGTVRLRVTDTVAFAAEDLATKLFEHYVVPREQGAELPEELELDELLGAVSFHSEQCAAGKHHWAEGIGEGTAAQVREWAAVQVERLLPYLTWGRTG